MDSRQKTADDRDYESKLAIALSVILSGALVLFTGQWEHAAVGICIGSWIGCAVRRRTVDLWTLSIVAMFIALFQSEFIAGLGAVILIGDAAVFRTWS